MIILDSNIWIAYFNENDPTHTKAKKLIQHRSFSDIVLTEYILLEVVTILKQKVGWERADQFLKMRNEFDIPIIESLSFFEGTLHLFRSLREKYLSFVDVSLLVLAHEYKIETFDKRLKKEIGRR